jgi:hypothetical protein
MPQTRADAVTLARAKRAAREEVHRQQAAEFANAMAAWDKDSTLIEMAIAYPGTSGSDKYRCNLRVLSGDGFVVRGFGWGDTAQAAKLDAIQDVAERDRALRGLSLSEPPPF